MGQHFPFIDRCPNNEKLFALKDYAYRKEPYLTKDDKQSIADYDNAVHYTDKMWGRVVGMLRNTNSVVVFISDHGEEVFDYRKAQARPPMDDEMCQGYLHCQHDVPFTIWCSTKYMQNNSGIVKEVRSLQNNRLLTRDVYTLLLNLGGVKTNLLGTSTEDLMELCKVRKREIYLRGNGVKLDYDSICCGAIKE